MKTIFSASQITVKKPRFEKGEEGRLSCGYLIARSGYAYFLMVTVPRR